ncbi:MAG: UDP-N-acetylmuramate dehydrogenase [Magnetococcus sp. YQC-5]
MTPFPNISRPILTNIPLATRTTWRIGGPATWLLQPISVAELTQLLQHWPQEMPRFLLGGGSTILIADAGFKGAVLDLTHGMKRIYTDQEESIKNESAIIHADAGAATRTLAHFAQHLGLTGAEFLSGIPGSVGGAVLMNAGAYGSSIQDILLEADLLDPSGTPHRWPVEQLGMGYRTSGIPEDWIVTAARFRFQQDDPVRIRDRMRGFNRQRRASQPLEFPSAGSVFKNPLEGPKAWELIDHAGLRGISIGDAQVSTKHSNFLVNRGQARAEDMMALIHHVMDKVEKNSNIQLEPEVKWIGM